MDQGGGTGGVIERQESNDSLDKEMQEIFVNITAIVYDSRSSTHIM